MGHKELKHCETLEDYFFRSNQGFIELLLANHFGIENLEWESNEHGYPDKRYSRIENISISTNEDRDEEYQLDILNTFPDKLRRFIQKYQPSTSLTIVDSGPFTTFIIGDTISITVREGYDSQILITVMVCFELL